MEVMRNAHNKSTTKDQTEKTKKQESQLSLTDHVSAGALGARDLERPKTIDCDDRESGMMGYGRFSHFVQYRSITDRRSCHINIARCIQG